jgi:antitoxin component of RelBE/YafQ-DinJ toxin-antitoxin module
MNKTNKDSFIILRVTAEMRKEIYRKAKDMNVTVSSLLRDILSENI